MTFFMTPEEPDADDRTGMSEAEHQQLMDALMELGGEDIRVEKEA